MPTSIIQNDTPWNTRSTYTVYFSGVKIYTTVTHNSEFVTEWISMIEKDYEEHLNHLIVGLVTRASPYEDDVATLQLCVGHRCLIFQLLYADEIPSSLDGFLRNSGYTFVGVHIESNIDKLYEDYGIGGRTVNMMNLCEEYGYDVTGGLSTLSAIILEKGIPKPKKVGAWDAAEQALRQIRYASICAFATFKIGRIFQARTKVKNRDPNPVAVVAVAPPPPTTDASLLETLCRNFAKSCVSK